MVPRWKRPVSVRRDWTRDSAGWGTSVKAFTSGMYINIKVRHVYSISCQGNVNKCILMSKSGMCIDVNVRDMYIDVKVRYEY